MSSPLGCHVSRGRIPLSRSTLPGEAGWLGPLGPFLDARAVIDL